MDYIFIRKHILTEPTYYFEPEETNDTISPIPTIYSPTNSSYATTTIDLNYTVVESNPNRVWYEYNPTTWLYPSWLYKKEIAITTDYNYTHYPLNFTINLSSEYSAGKINQTCKDIRFTNSSEDGELYYDIVICDLSTSDNATFSIHLDTITTDNDTIFMYYGNDNIETTQNYYNTYYRHEDDLVLDLPLKLGSGNTAWDVSGSGYNGTITDATWVSGGGLSFDGTGDYVDHGYHANLNILNNRTIIVWINANGQYSVQDGVIVSNRALDPNRGYSMRMNIDDTISVFHAGGAIISSIPFPYISNSIMLSWTQNDASGGIVYYNDTNVDSTATATDAASSPADLTIGRGPYLGGCAYYNGSIFHVKIYDIPLTPTQISRIYNETQYPPTYSLSSEQGNPNTTLTDNTTLTALDNQQSTLILWANDTSGNLNSTSVTFTVDTTDPTLTLYSPTNSSYNTTTIDLNYTSTDTNLDTTWYEYNSANTTLTTNTTLSAADGQSTFIIWSNDSAGNTNSINIVFTTDTLAPNTTASAIKDDETTYTFNTLTNSAYVNVTLTCSDSISQDMEYSYSCENSFSTSKPCSNAVDEDWSTYAHADSGLVSYIYENFTVEGSSANWTGKYLHSDTWSPGDRTIDIWCKNSSNLWD